MKCNPLRWLWGILPLALAWWVALLSTQERVQQDLAQRTREHLDRTNLQWASVEFKGRDGMLVGRAEEESDQRRPAIEAAKVWGVRSLEDRIEVLQLIKDYVWRAAAQDNTLSLTGYVPNEAAHKAILGYARSAFPKHKVDDKLDFARGAPEQKVWLSGTQFALRQLAALKFGGRVALEGAGLVIDGEADSPQAYETVRNALSRSLPQGISLKTDRVVPPAVKPYTWAAALRGRQIELTGHVPSVTIKDQVKAAAERVLSGAQVVDRTTFASGAPRDWQKIVSVALTRLGQLKQGSAELSDTQLTFNGLTETEDAAEAVKRALRNEVAAPFRLVENIRQDPAVKAAEEAAKRAAEEAAARRAQEEARRQAEAEARRDAAEADARRAAEEAARIAAADAEAKRQADTKRKAEEDARRQQAEVEARKRADEERQKARVAEAQRCQQSLRSAAEAGTITFQRASAELDRRSHRTLDNLAQIAKGCPGYMIEVAGHTDNEGEPDRKKRLSERRARSVLDYLVRAGVSANSIEAVGFGDSQPKVPNDSPANMALNRRIEFSVKPK